MQITLELQAYYPNGTWSGPINRVSFDAHHHNEDRDRAAAMDRIERIRDRWRAQQDFSGIELRIFDPSREPIVQRPFQSYALAE